MIYFHRIAIKDIELGKARKFGHETYRHAVHKPSGKKIIAKKNKRGSEELTHWELMFTRVASLFLGKGFTCSQNVMLDNQGKVLGLVTKHICYVIAEKEGLNSSFFSLNPRKKTYRRKKIHKAEDIPLYFLDDLPANFFSTLLKSERQGRLEIDYASLANVMATSFALQDIDLHKENYGYYLIASKNGRPRLVFFKIDHDLMFTGHIMSFKTRRFFHWLDKVDIFNITADDLINFPNIKTLAHAYWPTTRSYFSNLWTNKGYHDPAEVSAFASLSDIQAFQKAKWRTFYKHILLPEKRIQLFLQEGLHEQDAASRERINLLMQSLIIRQAQLKSVLFSIKAFRDFVANLSQEEKAALVQEITEPYSQAVCEPVEEKLEPISEQVKEEVESVMCFYEQPCQPRSVNLPIVEKDTPLHSAIKLGEYRYEETLEMFGQYIHQRNSEGKTPLDVAADRLVLATAQDVRQDAVPILQDLLANGAKETSIFQKAKGTFIAQSKQYSVSYLQANSLFSLNEPFQKHEELKARLVDIGKDHRFSLKYKKNLALSCIAQFIRDVPSSQEKKKALLDLKDAINQSDILKNDLQYIKQLRSRWFIIRYIKGLFGQTLTQYKSNSMLDKAIDNLRQKEKSKQWPLFFQDHLIPIKAREVPTSAQRS
jgi:hypothetical protein